MHNADYTLCEPFDIDGGELDGLSLQQSFVLGVEWQMFRAQLLSGEPFKRMVHAANVGRLTALCSRHGRKCREEVVHDDWRVLLVE